MEEKQKIGFAEIKARLKGGFRTFVTFFKEFKWDKAHLAVLGKYVFEVLFFAFIIAFDLCMKPFLYDFVEVKHGGNYTVIEGFFDLTYSENTGMGFGFGKNSTLGLIIITSIVIVAILGYLVFFKKEKAYIRIPLIMVAAGGIGNLVDRVQLGYVRDFFEFTFMDFAIFNIADAFVTVGAIALIIALIVVLFKSPKKQDGNENAEIPADGEENGGISEHDDGKVAFTVTDSEGNAVESALGAEGAVDDATDGEAASEKENSRSESYVDRNAGRTSFTIAPVDETEKESKDE